MKRCPTCNRTFDEEWLAFCTEDGSTLLEISSKPASPEPPATVRIPGAQTNPAGQQPFDLPGSYNPPQPATPAWRPPPPPPMIRPAPQQGLAVASLICGLISITIGWCYIALISGPVAIALGIAALNQVKNKPDRYGGKPLAIVGIVTGAIPFLVLLFIIVLAVAMQAVK
jgi:hypothetical protein